MCPHPRPSDLSPSPTPPSSPAPPPHLLHLYLRGSMYVECARQWDTTGGAVPQTDLFRYPLCPKHLRTTDRPHTLTLLNRDTYKILLVHRYNSNEGEAYKIILVFIQGYTCTVLFMIRQLANKFTSTWDIHFMMLNQ